MENNENREFYVYQHIRLDNNTCFYIGKGKDNRKDYLYRNQHHDRISNKYGHAVVIIKDNLTEEEAFELERDTIEDYVFNLGYGINIDGYRDYSNNEYLTNMTFGGEGNSGIKFSKEHKRKIGEANKGKHRTNEAKRKLSEALKGKMKGENHPMYGKHHTEETKQKMSESMKGIKFSEEHKLNLSESHSKKVICITTGKIFNSQSEAGNHYNVSQGNISSCCKRKLKSAGKLQDGTKLKWCYLEDYDNEFKLNIN